MKSCIFFLVLIFAHLVVNLQPSNVTEEDANPVCPLSSFRRKRAFTEYTRWRTNQESTQEFIVKVLDEDLSTPQTKQIVAVNIQPVTKGTERIIVGGAMVPPPTSSVHKLTELTKEYTRFVAPTTVPVTRVDEEVFLAPILAPIAPEKLVPMSLKAQNVVGRNSQRDESPPASPQFLTRTPTILARQYAPIAPVVFTRHPTLTPLTPPAVEKYNRYETDLYPTRSTPLPKILVPTRTKHFTEDLRTEQPSDDDESSENKYIVTRSTFIQSYPPVRSTIATMFYNELLIPTPTNSDDFRRFDNTKKNKVVESSGKDIDASYNMMFYNDDDMDSSTKNGAEDNLLDHYEEKQLETTKVLENETETELKEATLAYDLIEYDNTTEKEFQLYSDLDKNIEDLVKGITNEDTATVKGKVTFKEKLRGKRRPVCNMITLRQLNFNSPRTLHEIVSQLNQWADNSPVAKWIDITGGNYTTMENPIYMMIVDDPSSGQIVSAKQTVMIVAGIQGRDQHAVAAAMYILYQFIERSEAHTDLLTKYRFWIIPVFNPDGYDYSMTFPHRREWSKNLRQCWEPCKERESCKACDSYGIRCTIQPCYGVNLDRNFEYQWIPAEELQSEHPCGPLHAGVRQLSESETRALTQFLHDQQTKLYMFIALKEGDVLGIMYPYSHTRKRRAFDHVYRQRASRAASAANSISGRPYVAGQTSEFLPLYAGGIEDWVDGHLGIDNTYTIMMFRPTDSYNAKLITERVVHEAYAAMDTLLLQTVEPLGPPIVMIKGIESASSINLPYLSVFTTLAGIFLSS